MATRSWDLRTFDLEKALICSGRSLVFDQDYHVYHYVGLGGKLWAQHLVFHPADRQKKSINSVTCNSCEILMVIFFYVAGFPRKQTGKRFLFSCNFLWGHACLWVGNPVETNTCTEFQMREMRQVLLGLVCCNTEVFRVCTKHSPHSTPPHSCAHTHTCTHTHSDWQRGPSSKGGPSPPFTVNRTVAFHSWGRYRQRQPYIASQGSSRSLALWHLLWGASFLWPCSLGHSAERLHILSGCHIIQ